MKIETARFGPIECEERELLYLPEGLIGFTEFKRVVLLDHQKESVFRWLQSVDNPELAFVVIDPLLLDPSYPLELLQTRLAKFGPRPETVAAAAITTVPPAPAPITVNLMAPLAFNPASRQGAQIIIEDKKYHTKHLIVRDPPDTPKPELNQASESPTL